MNTFLYPLAALILSLSLISVFHYRNRRQAGVLVSGRRMQGRST